MHPDISTYQEQNNQEWSLLFKDRHYIQTAAWQFHVDYRALSFTNIEQNPFYKLLKNTKKNLRICDASAGLGRDSYFMTELGFQVDSIEQHPVLFTLMREGHEKCLRKHDTWQIHWGKCESIIGESMTPDIIYYDPMFDKKMTLSQKYAQVLQHYAEADSERTLKTFDFLYNYCKSNGIRLMMKQPQKTRSQFPKAHHKLGTSRNCECWIYQF
jgi:hypothetical protein